MPSLELLIPFFLATAIFACVPGPGMFYAAAQTIARGRHAGWLSALGFHVGGYVHISAAAFGLAVLLETVPVLYVVVKFAGAAYLIWLGIKFFMSPKSLVMSVVATEEKPHRHAIRDSIVVEVLNPKNSDILPFLSASIHGRIRFVAYMGADPGLGHHCELLVFDH